MSPRTRMNRAVLDVRTAAWLGRRFARVGVGELRRTARSRRSRPRPRRRG